MSDIKVTIAADIKTVELTFPDILVDLANHIRLDSRFDHDNNMWKTELSITMYTRQPLRAAAEGSFPMTSRFDFRS